MGISSSQDTTVRFPGLPWIHHRSLVTDNLQRFTQAEISHLFQHRARNRFPDDLQHLFIDEQHFQVIHDSIFKGISHSSFPKGLFRKLSIHLRLELRRFGRKQTTQNSKKAGQITKSLLVLGTFPSIALAISPAFFESWLVCLKMIINDRWCLHNNDY